jgi:hypothetical protein
MTGIGDEFTCANCGGRFVKARSDAEAMTEALNMYPAEDLAGGIATVCDGCFTEMAAWARENAPELLRETP